MGRYVSRETRNSVSGAQTPSLWAFYRPRTAVARRLTTLSANSGVQGCSKSAQGFSNPKLWERSKRLLLVTESEQKPGRKTFRS